MEQFKLQLNCSPKTFKLIQSNPQCQEEVLKKLTESEEEPFEEIIISETQSEQCQNSLDDESDADPKKNEWLDAQVKLLISSVKELRPQVGKSAKLKTKKKMWQTISELLSENGYIYNAQQVEGKYYALERQYKKNRLHNSLTGRNRQTCSYQAELDDLLLERKCINPEYVLDEETSASTADEDEPNSSCTFSKSIEKECIYLQKLEQKRRKSTQEQILDKFDCLIEQSAEFETKTLKLLEEQAERDRKKEERAKREEERKKKKLELLENLLSKIN